jgi:hypothetical protein
VAFRDWVLLLSALVSFVSVAATVWTWKRSQDAARLQAQMERFFLFEGKLAEWPEAFHFYDIDLEAARREGVTEKQIAYLVLAINALMADYRSRPGRTGLLGRPRTLVEFVAASTYWSHLLRQPRTALVWRWAENCVSEPWRSEIARFVAQSSSVASYVSPATHSEENRVRLGK